MTFDRERVRRNAAKADTQDLLDRLTVFRAGMEPEALEVIEAELRSRGVTTPQLREHEERRAEAVLREEGVALCCSFCFRPAVARGRRWHRLFGLLPLFPREVCFCEVHLPPRTTRGASGPHSRTGDAS